MHIMGGLLKVRFEPDSTGETWERWQGRTVAGKYQLQRYLGGTAENAVFLTSMTGDAGVAKEAAIRLISVDSSDAEKQLRGWKAAAELSHPNLIRIFETGRSEQDGVQLVYVVEEYAEENLSQILPERALTPTEAREMLPPVLRALQFLHGRGFAHGRIQPSNILAIGDQVKLSSDKLSNDTGSGARELTRTGNAASAYHPPESATGTILAPGVAPADLAPADAWQLGVMLVEVLTQRPPRLDLHQNRPVGLPEGIPQPFREIIENCLRTDPAQRWTIAQIAACLEGRQPAPPPGPVAVPAKTPAAVSTALPDAAPRKQSAKWLYAIASVVAASIVIFLIARPKPSGAPSGPPPNVQSTQIQQSAAPESSQSMPSTTQPQLPSTGVATASSAQAVTATADENGVVHRVIPQVTPGARSTVRGTIVVRARVTVDSTGDVTKAKIVSGGASRYFSRIALEAARDWKFVPAQSGEQGAVRKWNLQFSFNRKKTDASAAQTKR
jgi:TonB family protein